MEEEDPDTADLATARGGPWGLTGSRPHPRHCSLLLHSTAPLRKQRSLPPWGEVSEGHRAYEMECATTPSCLGTASAWRRMGAGASAHSFGPTDPSTQTPRGMESLFPTVAAGSGRHLLSLVLPFPHFPPLLPVLPGVASQISRFHPNPGLKVCSWRTRTQVLN